MSNTITVRLTEEQSAWLRKVAEQTGMPVSEIVRGELDRARSESKERPWMKHLGRFSGPPDLSTRKGYSRS